jgi:excisionase family DNA binding protein
MSRVEVDDEAPTDVFFPPVLRPLDRARLLRADGLWDVGDVAEYLKVSRSWVYHRAETRQLPHVRVGGLLRFDPTAIRSFARGEAPPAKTGVALQNKARR